MKLSKTMITQGLTLIMALLSLPAFLAYIPVGAMPYVALAAGALQVLYAWVDQYFGAVTLMAILTLVGGILAVPDLLAVIPPQWTQYLVLITAMLSLITRANLATPALKFGVFKIEV